MSNRFPALRTRQTEAGVISQIEPMTVDALSAGDVVVKTRYAGVNYKDCLSIHGQAKIIASFPRIAGIELVGEVIESTSPEFRRGQWVLVHGFQTGIAFDGGFAACARVPAAHVHALPEGLTPHEVAILGVCKSQTEPVWDGKQFQPRLMLPLSLSWDHRVIDGASAARFNGYLGQVLADFRRVLL
jgi:D-arabinose 1-dehydrogenase-like Zn-dependent alcohol dehydrogenase